MHVPFTIEVALNLAPRPGAELLDKTTGVHDTLPEPCREALTYSVRSTSAAEASVVVAAGTRLERIHVLCVVAAGKSHDYTSNEVGLWT